MKRIGIILNRWKANYKDYPLYGFKTDLIEFLRKYDINVLAIPILFENDINSEFKAIKDVIDLCECNRNTTHSRGNKGNSRKYGCRGCKYISEIY